MVCTLYNKVLSLPVLNKSAIGHALGQDVGERHSDKALRLLCGRFLSA
jgi:hypothetical protein